MLSKLAIAQPVGGIVCDMLPTTMTFQGRARFLSSFIVACALAGAPPHATAQTAPPDTPAGHALAAWLTAINSDDRAVIESYVKTVDPSQTVDGMVSFHKVTGGFQLLTIESSKPLHIHFRVKEKVGPTNAYGNLIVKEGQPPQVTSFSLEALPPNVTLENVTVDDALRKKVLEGVSANIDKFYIDAALAHAMMNALTEHQKAGDYNTLMDPDALARRLTNDLRAVSHDKHLGVQFQPYKSIPDAAPTAADIELRHQQIKQENCDFEKVEILGGNIGYIKFNAFVDPEICASRVTAAMDFVAYTDALIFDLRSNGGGDPAMVTLIASYLFDKPTHLNDLYNRQENSTHQFWTATYLPGKRMTTTPVYVLTSHRTFSGAEEFSYDLKNQKRATIVGETTGGGAHPVSGHVVADYFNVNVPFATAINPVSKTNWEGTGVEPDVKVPAADALATAEKLAAAKLQGK